MVVALLNRADSASSAVECAGCNGLSVDSLGNRLLQAIPGQSISYTARVLGSGKVPLATLLDDNVTLETQFNHCLAVDDPIHVCITDGVCVPLGLDPCLFIESVPGTNQFTLKDSNGAQVQLAPELVDDPTPNDPGVPVTGWIARSANLTGFEGRLTLRVNDNRQDGLLGVGAIANGRNQMQVKGHWASHLAIGDQLTLNDFNATVEAYRNLNTCDGVPYTVVQVDTPSTKDIPFTDNYLIYFQPESLVLEAQSSDPSCGWVTVTLQGSETLKLLQYKQDCITAIGTWSFSLNWGAQSLPAHMTKAAPVIWSHIFDSGTLLV